MKKLISVILVSCMLLSCGMANAAFQPLTPDDNIVRIGIFADSHVVEDATAINNVISAFETLDSSLDGIVMGGDIVANQPATLNENLYDCAVADEKLSLWLNKKPVVSTETRTINDAEYSVGTNSGEAGLVWVMGNHEFNTNNNDVAQPEAWKLFQDKTELGIRGNVTMGGYHFIYSAAQGYTGIYTDEDQNWMMEELDEVLSDEDYAGKPVFLVLHHAIPDSYHDTKNGKNGSNFIAGNYTEEFVNYVKSQPRIIEFSAHTHYPIQDPRMIRQPEEGGFTAVQIPFAGNGSFTLDRSADIRTASQGDSYGQALMMEINKTTNVVTIKRLNVKDSEYIGNDWTIDVGALALGNGYNYTDARYETGTAPEFDEGEITVSDITASTARVTFPAATRYSAANETNYAHIYEVKAIRNGIVDYKQSMVSDYYKTAQADTLSMDLSNLKADSNYSVEVTAISPYGKTAKIESTEFITEESGSNQDTDIDDSKQIVAGTDDSTEGITFSNISQESVSTAVEGVKRWVTWIGGDTTCYVEWTFVPSYTGTYTFDSRVSFTDDTSITNEPTVSMSVDGSNVGSVQTSADDRSGGSNGHIDMNFGKYCLKKDNTYKIRTSITAGTGLTSSIWSSKVSYVGPVTEDFLIDKEIITLNQKVLPDNAEGGTHNDYNASRWRFWVEDTDGIDNVTGYIAWDITPEYTGVYEIDAYYGYLPGERYSDNTPAKLDATIDGERVGNLCTPSIIDSSNNRANHTVFGRVALEAGKTYRLCINFYGQQYNVYLDNAYLTYKGAADPSEFWKDSVMVNGWEPEEKNVSSSADNYGVIIAQSNHYATYNVSPGAGFFKLSITYGAGSSLDADAPVTLNVNGKDMGTIIAPDNDSYWPEAGDDACTLDMGVIELDEGINTITLGHTGEADAAYYSVGSLTVTAVTEPVSSLYRGLYADADNEITEIEDGAVTAYARLPRSLNGQKVFVVFAVYEVTTDNQNRLVGADSKSVNAGAAEGVVLSVSDISKAEGSNYRYRVFYLDDIDTLKPLF